MLQRPSLAPGAQVEGPAVLVQLDTTTWLAPGWLARVHESGALLLERRER